MKQKTTLFIWCLTLILIVVAGWFYTQIQDSEIIIHWNALGIADGYGNKSLLFLFVLIIPGFDILLLLLRKIDPKRKNYDKFDTSFHMIRLLLACFFGMFFLLSSIAQLYPQHVNIGVIVSLLCAMLFVVLGNLMPRMRRNYMMGIRTPWTIANETVWIKTHRFGGRLWFFSGCILLFVPFLPLPYHLTLFFTFMVIIGISPCIYSYILYRKLKRKGDLYD